MTGAIYPGPPPWPATEDRLSPALTGAIHGRHAPAQAAFLTKAFGDPAEPVGENKPTVCASAARSRPLPGAHCPPLPPPDSKAPWPAVP